MIRKKPLQYEAIEQKIFFETLKILYPKARETTFSIPNGGFRNKFEANNLKEQGVTAGVPDIFCAIPNKSYCGLFIELKRTKKQGTSTISKSQKNMIELLSNQGYLVKVCYGSEEAIKSLSEYLSNL